MKKHTAKTLCRLQNEHQFGLPGPNCQGQHVPKGELNDLNFDPVFKEENVELYSDFEMEEKELWERLEQLRIQEQQMHLDQL